MEIRTKRGARITITEDEMPVSVSGAQADGIAVLDVIECARAIKTMCKDAEDCRTCAFGRDGGSRCLFKSWLTPDSWEV